MSGRVLRIELRRSSAWPTGLVIALLGVAGLLSLVPTNQQGLWDAQWTLLASFQRIMLVVLWPLTLGAGAWQARRDRRGKAEELLGTTALPVWRRVLPTAVAMALCLVVGYVLIFAVGAVKVVGTTDYVTANWVPVALVGALSLVAAGWLGLGIGRLVPSVYTPPVLVVLGFLVLLVPIQLSKEDDPGPGSLLGPGFVNNVREFQMIAPSVDLGQFAWFLGLALAGLLLALFGRRIASVVAVVPVVLALVVALPIFGAAPAGGVQADPAASAEVCAHDGGPTVCVTASHAQDLAALVGPARQALAALATLPNPPTSVHEVPDDRPGPQPADQVWFDAANHTAGQGWDARNGAELEARILAGAGTKPCEAENTADRVSYEVRPIVAAWLIGQYPAPGMAADDQGAALWRTLTALPKAEQAQRVAAVRQAGLACGDVGAALSGGH